MKKLVLATVSTIIIVTAILEALIFLRITRLPYVQVSVLGATNSLTHWIGWIGALYIAFVTPFQPTIKRKAPTRLRSMLTIHIIGNSLAVLLVSVHFAQQVTRPASAFPDLGTGILLYVAMLFLVATGIARYSGVGKRFIKQFNFLHSSFALLFYLIIIVHILHGVSII